MVADRLRNVILEFPRDLGAVLALLAVVNLSLFLPAGSRTTLRLGVELLLVLVLPGYPVVAALFPKSGRDATNGPDDSSGGGDGVDAIERVVFSLALSVAIVPLVGLALNYSPWGLRPRPVLAGISGFVVLATAVATVRRMRVPREERFRVDAGRRLRIVRDRLLGQNRTIDQALTVLVAVGFVLAVTSVAYAVSVPTEGERHTEFYLLTEDEDGTLVADEYPQEFRRGESRPVVLRIANQESSRVEYSVVVELQDVRTTDGATTVIEDRELDRIRTGSLAHGDTWTREYSVTPTMTGERLRLAFMLYRGSPPDDPSIETASRSLQLQVNVSAAGSTEADG